MRRKNYLYLNEGRIGDEHRGAIIDGYVVIVIVQVCVWSQMVTCIPTSKL